ncbi:MAG: sensor histidine kinase [Thermodesulfobacteriota bacterium]
MLTIRPISLRTLLALLCVMTALPAFAIIWHLGMRMVDQALEQAHGQALSAVSAAAAALEQEAGEARGLLRALSETRPIRELNPQASHSLLSAISASNPKYANLLLISPEGEVIASSRPHSWVNMAQRKHTREALRKKGFAAGEYIFSPYINEPLFPFSHAILGADGEVKAVLVAALKLTPGLLLPGSFPLAGGFSLAVLDHAGVRMLRLPRDEEAKPEGARIDPALLEMLRGAPSQASAEVRYANSERWLFSSRALSLEDGGEPYMHVVAGIERDAVLGAIRDDLYASLGLMILATLLAAASALAAGEFAIVRPMGALARQARSIGAGNPFGSGKTWRGPRELAGLFQAFDAMSLSIERRDEKRRRLIQALRASRARFKDVSGSISDWIWEMDTTGKFTFVSGRVRDVLGYQPEDMLGKEVFSFLIPGECERCRAIFEENLGDPHEFKDMEIWHLAKDGRKVCMRASGLPLLDEFGAPRGYRGVCVDVTAQKAAEERILRSLAEKEVLLKEVHHRVKNNLQIISSLMSLESQEYPHIPEVEEAFGHMRGRVRSIALIHQMLYASGDFAAVEMAAYVENLTRSIKDSSELPGKDVTLKLELSTIHLSLDQALPLSLAVNEMVTNAFKHAFGAAASGEITVRLSREEDAVFLEVHDTGKGFDPGVTKGERHGLGFQLIMALADQLGGEVRFPERGGGASILLTFKRNPIP